jgi:cyanate permease
MTRPHWVSIASVCYVGSAAIAILNGLPAIAATLKATRRLSNDEIGWLAAAHLLGLALSSAACPYILRFLGARRLLAIGVFMVISGLAVLAMCTSSPLTYGGFIISGLGTGVANAVICVLLGEYHQERNISLYYCAQWLSTLFLLFFIPKIVSASGISGVFVCLAIVNVLSITLLRFVKEDYSAMRSVVLENKGRTLVWIRSMALLSIGALFACEGAIWTFLEISGRERGFTAADANAAATASPIFGLLGSLAVIAISRRYGQTVPLVVSACALGLSLGFLTNARWGIYVSGACLFTFSFSIFAAYQFGLATDHDKSGFTAAWASTATCIGFGAGPAIAGAASEAFGADGVVGVGVVGAAFAFLLSAILLHRLPGRGQPTNGSLRSRLSG